MIFQNLNTVLNLCKFNALENFAAIDPPRHFRKYWCTSGRRSSVVLSPLNTSAQSYRMSESAYVCVLSNETSENLSLCVQAQIVLFRSKLFKVREFLKFRNFNLIKFKLNFVINFKICVSQCCNSSSERIEWAAQPGSWFAWCVGEIFCVFEHRSKHRSKIKFG